MEQVLEYYAVDYNGSKTGNQSFRCPVHEDSHASASLNLDEGVFHCHACGAGGSGYDLIMAKEGIDFASARQFAENIVGVSGERVRAGAQRASQPVPRGSGYQPRYRKKVQAGQRRERTAWT
jgi:DNA primase